MSRRISTKKRFPIKDLKYNNFLVTLLINRILKRGKKQLATKIVYEAFELIQTQFNMDPLNLLEKAILKVSPKLQVKTIHRKDSVIKVPTIINKFRSINLALKWIAFYSRKRFGKTASIKLAAEILDASKGLGNSFKKREELHKLAESKRTILEISN